MNLGMKLTASAGSDYPVGSAIGEVKVYAYIGRDEEFSIDKWFDAFAKGRTFVTSALFLEFQVDDALPGDEIHVKRDRQLRVTAKVRGHAKLDLPRRLEIVQFGKVIKKVVAKKRTDAELTLDFTISAGHGGWLAARAYGRHKASAAHTSAIWVIREGLRPWDHQNVPAAIGMRMTSLKELEEELERIKKVTKTHPYIDQWPELKKRIDDATKIYEDLRQLYEKEKPMRN